MNWRDVQTDFDDAHYINGFAWPDKKFRFKPRWNEITFRGALSPNWRNMPEWPDHWAVIEETDDAHPFRLATSPARSFLNSTFNETASSRAREGRPCVFVHPHDAATLGIADGDKVILGNTRGEVRLHAKLFDGVQRGVLISEGIWPNDALKTARASIRSPARTPPRPTAARRSTTTRCG